MQISEATTRWLEWRSRRWQRRRVLTWASALALAGVVVGLLAWGGFPPLLTVGEKGEAVEVKLGHPEGEDLPLSVQSVPDQALQAVMSAQRDTALSTVEETRPVAAPEAAGPVPASNPSPSKVASKPAAKPSPSPAPAVPKPDAPNPVQTEKVIRGSEKGNSSELILKPQGDKISQNAYWPVYLFMPLPERIDQGLLARVKATDLYTAEERRDLLLQFYKSQDGALVLQGQPALAVRPVAWEILETAGYDLANADYKRGRSLRPVILSFRLGIPKASGANPELLDVKLEQSSGSGPVDEAVLYAFQKSSFANGTGQVANGRYTYDFSPRR